MIKLIGEILILKEAHLHIYEIQTYNKLLQVIIVKMEIVELLMVVVI